MMLVEDKTNNVGLSDCSPIVSMSKNSSSNGDSFRNGGGTTDGSNGSISVEGVRTYKRRKQMMLNSESKKLHEDFRVFVAEAAEPGLLVHENIKQRHDEVLKRDSDEQNGPSRIDNLLLAQGPSDCIHQSWKRSVLGILSKSKDDGEDSLRGCIQDAVKCSSLCSCNVSQLRNASDSTSHAPDTVCCHLDRRKDYSNVNLDVSQDGPNNQPPLHVMTERCQYIFSDILVSEKFDLLCKLLRENFQGIKAESFTDFHLINSRFTDGAYEKSPRCFFSDIQQVWQKFENIGKEMVSFARHLADLSDTAYIKQFRGVANGICEGEKQEQTTAEQADDSSLDKVCSCRLCGAKPHGKDYLVCDSCEEMYHVSCIEPAVEEIPRKNWYCTNCTNTGESLHADCVVCDRIKDCRTEIEEDKNGREPMEADIVEEKSVSSVESEENGVGCFKREKLINRQCKQCQGDIEEGQKFKICEHEYCPFRIYHARCLTNEQLKYHGPLWYCPSCLCRTCLTDEDDDKILLCDGCDHAYHMYCVEPPLSSIPKGKWFCEQCNSGIQKIQRAKMSYKKKNCQKEQRMNGSARGSTSVDMLLNAAEKLKTDENLANGERNGKRDRKQEES